MSDVDGALESGVSWDDLGELKAAARSAGWNKSKWGRALEGGETPNAPTVTSTQSSLSVFISEHHVGSEGFQSTVETASQLLIRAAEREPHKACELRLRGVFHPTAKVVINWPDRLQQQLVVAGPGATISGEALPQGTNTLTVFNSVSVQGIHFPASKGTAVMVAGNCLSQYEVKDCVFEDCAGSAIKANFKGADDYLSEAPVVHGRIVGNCIKGFNRDDEKWKNDGISVHDQGVLIADNYICDSKTEAAGIRAMGRDVIIERNWVEGVSVRDASGIYLGVAVTHAGAYRGRVVRWNVVIDAVKGIYLDDGTSGAQVYENVILGNDSMETGIFISGGRDNIIQRNAIQHAEYCFHLDARCMGWTTGKGPFLNPKGERKDLQWTRDSLGEMRQVLLDPQTGPIWRERYPELQKWTDENLTAPLYGRPEGNQFAGNFAQGFQGQFHIKMSGNKLTDEDFEAWNTLTPAAAISPGTELHTADLMDCFGFEGLMCMDDVATEARKKK